MNLNIVVDTSKRILRIGELVFPCAIGKNGTIPESDGREGDGKTPLGTYPVRYGLYRTDRIALPDTKLQFWQILRSDGWCDDPQAVAYNRPVRLPYTNSAESLWRESGVYDIIIVLGHNDSPPTPGMGSAIFLHIAREGYAPTEGCVAISKNDMLKLVQTLTTKSQVEIQ